MSPLSQLAFVALVKESVSQGSQFLIATHSPVVMASPGAAILSLDETPPGPTNPKAFVERL